MSRQLKADLVLVFVTMCWGISYLLSDICLAVIGPFTLNAMRFIIAFLVAAVIGHKRLRKISKETWKYSIFIGMALVGVYTCANFGLMYTSLMNAGFLCSLSVIFTPVAGFLFLRQRQSKRLMFVVILATAGIALLTLNGSMQPAIGDVICIGCSVFYTIDLLVTEKAVKKPDVDAFAMGILILGVTGTVNLILSLMFERTFPEKLETKVWLSVIILAIFCTGLAFIAQSVAQFYTTATHVGVIFALEPVFSGMVALFIAGEMMTGQAFIGAVLLIISIFIMEIKGSD